MTNPVYSYMLGTTYAGMVNLELWTPPIFAPKHEPLNYSKPTTVGDASVKALGWLTTAWHWDYLLQNQYNALKIVCPGLSAVVYINTKLVSGLYQVFRTTMLWPPKEPEVDHGKILDVTINYRELIVYTP